MRAEQRQRDALQPEPQARRVRRLPGGEADVEGEGELVQVVVEGADGGGGGAGVDRYQHLELEALLALPGGHHASRAAEEGVRGHLGGGLQPEPRQQGGAARQPRVTPGLGLGRGPHADELAHAERAQPGGLQRRLLPVHPRQHGHVAPAGRQRAAAGGVERVAGGGVEHQVGLRQRIAPGLPALHARRQRQRLPLVPLEGVDAPAQRGERLQVARALDDGAVDHRRKGELLHRLAGCGAAHQCVKGLQHRLEGGAAPPRAVRPGRDQVAVRHQRVVERRRVSHPCAPAAATRCAPGCARSPP